MVEGNTESPKRDAPEDAGADPEPGLHAAPAPAGAGTPRRSWSNRARAFRATDAGTAAAATRAARWSALEEVEPDLSPRHVRAARLVAMNRGDPVAGTFDVLRTQLMGALRANGWNRVAITAPTRGCGKTFCAVNLAISLSRMSAARIVLMDMDLRTPGIAATLGLTGAGAITGYLEGSRSMAAHLLRVGDNLALGLNDTPAEDAAEILQAPATRRALDAIQATLEPDVVLYDLPPALAHDDVAAFLPHVDAVLLVADGTRTLARDITECERMFDGRAPLLGVVLNKADDPDSRRYLDRGG